MKNNILVLGVVIISVLLVLVLGSYIYLGNLLTKETSQFEFIKTYEFENTITKYDAEQIALKFYDEQLSDYVGSNKDCCNFNWNLTVIETQKEAGLWKVKLSADIEGGFFRSELDSPEVIKLLPTVKNAKVDIGIDSTSGKVSYLSVSSGKSSMKISY